MLGFGGGNSYSPNPGAKLVSGQFYQYIFDDYVKDPGNRKNQPTLAMTRAGRVWWTSAGRDRRFWAMGPADSYKYCVARKAGECAGGSAAGDVYANVPTFDTPGALSGAAERPVHCAPSQLRVGGGAVGDDGEQRGQQPGLTQALTSPRNMFDYPTAKSLPDGSWAMFGLVHGELQQRNDGETAALCTTLDGRDRSTFLPLVVNLKPPADAADCAARWWSSGTRSRARPISTTAPAAARAASPRQRA